MPGSNNGKAGGQSSRLSRFEASFTGPDGFRYGRCRFRFGACQHLPAIDETGCNAVGLCALERRHRSSRYISAFRRRLQRPWMRALRRRSQRDRFDWKRLERMTRILWPPWREDRVPRSHGHGHDASRPSRKTLPEPRSPGAFRRLPGSEGLGTARRSPEASAPYGALPAPPQAIPGGRLQSHTQCRRIGGLRWESFDSQVPGAGQTPAAGCNLKPRSHAESGGVLGRRVSPGRALKPPCFEGKLQRDATGRQPVSEAVVAPDIGQVDGDLRRCGEAVAEGGKAVSKARFQPPAPKAVTLFASCRPRRRRAREKRVGTALRRDAQRGSGSPQIRQPHFFARRTGRVSRPGQLK